MRTRFSSEHTYKWVALGLAFSGIAVADESDPVSVSLAETTLVSEETSELSILESATNVDGDSLDKWSAEDLEGIFKTSLGVRAGGGRTQSQDVYIQGIQSTMANVTIDGAPQSGQIFYHAGSGGTIEPELLKSVTVSAGTSTALSGPGALGGALAYETKDGFDLLSNGAAFGGQVKGTYYADRNDGYKFSAMGYGLVSENWSYLVSGGYSDIGNYTDGNGVEVIDTKYKRTNSLAKLSGHFGSSHSLSLSYENIEDEGAGSARFNVYPDEASDLVNHKNRETVTVKYGFDPVESDLVDFQANVYYTDRNLESESKSSGIVSKGFDLRNTSLFADGIVKLAYGLDYKEDISSATDAEVDETGTVTGLYAQADWNLSDAFLLSAGGRFDTYDLEQRSGEDLSHDGFSPNVNAVYSFANNVKVHASYAEAMRGVYPSMSYLSTATTDPDIKPEESSNVEAGVEYGFGRFFVAAKVFETQIDDVINPRPRGSARTNIGDFTSSGYELTFGGTIENLRFTLGVTETDPEFVDLEGTSYDEYVSINSKVGRSWMGNVEYALPEAGFTFGWNTEYVESTTAVGARGTNEKESFVVHDAFVRWVPVADALEGVSVNLTASNLFDTAYYEQTTFAYMNGYAAPGRDVSLSFGYRF